MSRIKRQHTIRTNRGCNTIVTDGSKPSPTLTDISLANALAGVIGEKQNVPGRKYSGTQQLMGYKDAEYLYLTNGYIARGVDTEAAAIMRNGLEIVPTKATDKRQLDLILQHNDIELLTNEIARNVAIYGVQFMELYDDPITKTVRFELIPTPEMDYIRDEVNNIKYDKETGLPYGYVQKRVEAVKTNTPAVRGQKVEPNEIARWEGEDARRIVEFKYKTLGGCVEGIPVIQNTMYSAIEYGYIRSSLADSFIRSLPVAHIKMENPSAEDLEDAQDKLVGRFTARTFLLTSDAFDIDIKAPSGDIDVFKFIEPSLSETAACFHMPIELLAPTQYLKGDDFLDRYGEWVEYIKVKQKIIASIFEHKVFGRIFKNPIKVRFNSPVAINASDLIKNVGFAMQSGAITQEMAWDILEKAQVFGPYNIDIDKLKQKPTTDKSNTATQDRDANGDVQSTEPLQRKSP